MNACITYLAQNTQKDIHYGRDSRSMLEKSLDLLYKNYNDQFAQDILIFHEGDFDDKSQNEIRKDRKEIQFHQVNFELPDFLDPNEIPEKWDGIFGMGYRHMMRLYSLQVFDILHELGYDWFLRLDDDSFIHSRIDYDLFKFMAQNEFDYGYRVITKEPQRTSFGFSEMILAYLKAERIKPHTFLDHFDTSSKVNDEYFSLKGKIKNKITSVIDKISERLNHDLNSWPSPTEWDRLTVYTNFFITRIGFWKQREVQSLLHHFDRVGGGYKYRWGDHILQTAAIQIFLPDSKIHKFTDWTYEHATVKNEKLDWGGIYPGDKDQDNPAVKAFQEQFGTTKMDSSF